MASFLAIARLGSFRAGARERSLSQAAISQQIQKLEVQLGARLLERDAARCRLTAEGKSFHPYAEKLLGMSSAASRVFMDRPLTIGASSNIGIYLLSAHVKRFMQSSPETEPQVDIRIHQNPVVSEKLDCGEVDVALMEWWDGRKGFHAMRWREEELVVIVPPSHPWADRKRLAREDLVGVPLLGGEPGTGTGRLLAGYFGEMIDLLKVDRQLGSTAAVKQWVKAGMGVSIVLAGTVEEEVGNGSLVAVPLEGDGLRKELFVIWRDSLSPLHPASRFADWLLSDCLAC
ncbi:MAG: LysR family transcriptional regulator [Pseudomonadota bacterium]